MAELNIQDLMGIISSAPSWVRDATLEGINAQSNATVSRNLNRMNGLSKRFGLDPISSEVSKVIKKKQKHVRRKSDVRTTLSPLIRTQDPISGMSATIGTLATFGQGGLKFLGKGLNALNKSSGKSTPLGVIGKGIDKVAGGGLKATQLLAGFTAASAGIVASLEKDYRMMITLGAVRPADQMEELRGVVADSGLSLQEAGAMIAKSQGMMAGIGDDIFSGSNKFFKFTAAVEDAATSGAGGVSDFGRSAQDLASRMQEEASILYDLNDLQKSDMSVKGRVYKSFEAMETMLTGMASWTGARKSELLAEGMNAVKNTNFQFSLIQNREFIEKRYGEGAVDTVVENRRKLAMIFSQTPELQKMVLQASDAFVQDIERNGENAVISFQGSAYQELMVANPQAANQIAGLIKETMTGRKKGTDVDIAGRTFLQTLRNSDTRSGPDAMSTSANKLIAEANLVSNLDGSVDDMIKGYKNAKESSDAAGEMQDGLDNVSKAYRNTYAAMTPAFATTGKMFAELSGAVSELGNVLGLELELNPTEEFYNKRDQRNQEAENNLNTGYEKIKGLKDTPVLKKYYDNQLAMLKENYREELETANLTETMSSDAYKTEQKRIDNLIQKRFSGYDVSATQNVPVAGGQIADVMDTTPFETAGPIETAYKDSFLESTWNWLFGSDDEDENELTIEPKSIIGEKPVTITDSSVDDTTRKAQQYIKTLKEIDENLDKSFGVKKMELQKERDAITAELVSIMKSVNNKLVSENIKEIVDNGR